MMNNNTSNPYSIPAEITEAAMKVSLFFKRNNIRGWQLMDICDRIYAEKNSYNEGLDTAISIVSANSYFEAQETILCGLESSKILDKSPSCPNCGNDRQVWINQITKKLTCHRVGCNNLELIRGT